MIERAGHLQRGERLWVIHAGERAFDLGRKVRAVPLPHVLEELAALD